jgi:hypothetical protein
MPKIRGRPGKATTEVAPGLVQAEVCVEIILRLAHQHEIEHLLDLQSLERAAVKR